MPGSPGAEESDVCGENRAIVFQRECEINAIPHGDLVLE
jgi:hypothetical protein